MDKSILKKCLAGNADAFRELYDMYKSPWYMIALRYVRNASDAQDILQNSLIKIYQNLKNFDNKKGHFSSWSNTIVVNESIQFLRSVKKIRIHLELNDDILNIEEEMESVETVDAEVITKIIQNLPDGYRVVFNLYAIEGYSHAEIADILGVTENTSKSQYYKAKKFLKNKLEVII